MTRLNCLALFLATAFVVGAPEAVAAAPPTQSASSADEWLAELAQEVPGLGGFFYDRDGKPNVLLVGTVGEPLARLRFGPDVQIHPAQYEIGQLKAWRDRLRSALSLVGAIFLDLDEARNRVILGIARGTQGEDRDAFDRHVALRMVPREAVIIQESDPVALVQTLQDAFALPPPGGVQIDFSSFCTLGFNAGKEPGEGFVTCSHCTNVQGGEEGTQYSQGGQFLGEEYLDPPYRTGNIAPGLDCPPGRRCRRSDSAFVLYHIFPNVSAKMAKPDANGTCTGSINIDGVQPRFSVRGTQDFPLVGEMLHKVGRTTGWTSGNVTATCVDTNIDGTDITLFCQDWTDFGAQPGDSGSPVFRWNGGTDVTLYGLVWGAQFGGCGVIFSNLAMIYRDLDWPTVTTE